MAVFLRVRMQGIKHPTSCAQAVSLLMPLESSNCRLVASVEQTNLESSAETTMQQLLPSSLLERYCTASSLFRVRNERNQQVSSAMSFQHVLDLLDDIVVSTMPPFILFAEPDITEGNVSGDMISMAKSCFVKYGLCRLSPDIMVCCDPC